MKTLIAGTFDNFHIGHQWLLWNAFEDSEILTIIIARDATVHRIKGKAPKNCELKRLKRVEEEFAGFSNITIKLGRSDGHFQKTIEAESPQKILLGYDQGFPDNLMQKYKDTIVIERHTAFFPEIFKSSKF